MHSTTPKGDGTPAGASGAEVLLRTSLNVSVEDLQAWNGLSTPRIRIGQNLLVKPRT